MKIISICSVVLFFVYWLFIAVRFNKNLEEQMTKEDDDYFVVKARKLYLLGWVILSILLFLSIMLDKNNGKLDTIIAVIAVGPLVIGTILYFIYQSVSRIEYNNGQITYYVLNKAKKTGNINRLNIQECRNRDNPKSVFNMSVLYKDTVIVFDSEKAIHFQTQMINAYKLEAILKKRGCFKYDKK